MRPKNIKLGKMRKEGEYYYTPKGRWFSVYQNHLFKDGGGYGDLIKDYLSRDDAKKMVYELNGWTK